VYQFELAWSVGLHRISREDFEGDKARPERGWRKSEHNTSPIVALSNGIHECYYPRARQRETDIEDDPVNIEN
jgi:hypothetical protein